MFWSQHAPADLQSLTLELFAFFVLTLSSINPAQTDRGSYRGAMLGAQHTALCFKSLAVEGLRLWIFSLMLVITGQVA